MLKSLIDKTKSALGITEPPDRHMSRDPGANGAGSSEQDARQRLLKIARSVNLKGQIRQEELQGTAGLARALQRLALETLILLPRPTEGEATVPAWQNDLAKHLAQGIMPLLEMPKDHAAAERSLIAACHQIRPTKKTPRLPLAFISNAEGAGAGSEMPGPEAKWRQLADLASTIAGEVEGPPAYGGPWDLMAAAPAAIAEADLTIQILSQDKDNIGSQHSSLAHISRTAIDILVREGWPRPQATATIIQHIGTPISIVDPETTN